MGIKREKANPGPCIEVCATKKINVSPAEEGRENMAERSQLYFPFFLGRKQV